MNHTYLLVRDLLLVGLVVRIMLAVGEPSYSCPVCGTHREDEHDPSCPWKENR